MIKSLLLGACLIALLDPVLLYLIYIHAGFWPTVAIFAAPVMLGRFLLSLSRIRPVNEAGDVTQAFTPLVQSIGMMLFFYPGPITSMLGLLFIFPPTRKLVIRVATKRFLGSMAMQSSSGPMNWSFGSMRVDTPNPTRVHVNPGGLKQAEGRIVDEPGSRPALPSSDTKGK